MDYESKGYGKSDGLEFSKELEWKIDNGRSRRKRWTFIFLLTIILVLGLSIVGILYGLNVIPHAYYENEDFGIATYISQSDWDQDGVDDQTDILQGVRRYIATKPEYKSVYYEGGWPTDGYGVCTDVVAQGLLHAGYDLRVLVNLDVTEHPKVYNIDKPDSNIDFRRVRNLKVFFERHATVLTTDPTQIEEWQGGDIVIYAGSHIGIVSDKRNAQGVCFLIHHGSPYQSGYEQDVLITCGEIVGHYRWR